MNYRVDIKKNINNLFVKSSPSIALDKMRVRVGRPKSDQDVDR